MENNEKILEDISKELLNTFFYNKKVYAIQQYDEHNKVIYSTKYKIIDAVKIKYALENKIGLMSYQQNQNNLKWICLDFDIEKYVQNEQYRFLDDKVYRNRLIKDVNIAMQKLDELDIKYVIEYSGNRGVHIWIFFSEEISKAVGYTILEKIMKCIPFEYAFEEDTGITIDRYPKNGNSEGNKIGVGVKIPLSFHKKSGCHSYIIKDLKKIEEVKDFNTEFLQEQLNYLKKIERNSVEDIIKKLDIKDIIDGEIFARINGMVSKEYSLKEIINMLKKSKIFQKIFNKSQLNEEERRILVGTLIRLKSINDERYGENILKQFFKTLDNYDENITNTKIENLRNLYPPLVKEVERKLRIKCDYCQQNKITNTMELIDGVEFIDFSKTESLIKWVVKAEKDYLINNDEVPLEFVRRELEKIDVKEIEKEIELIKNNEFTRKEEYYKFIRHESEKDREMYSFSAKDRVISTTIMFLIDDIIGGEYTSSNGYSYKLNRNRYKNNKIFESWNYLWMNYKKEIEDKVCDKSFDDYYFIKLDLRKFYDSINHIFLREALYSKPNDYVTARLKKLKQLELYEYKNLCEYLMKLIENTNKDKGVPQGPAFARYLSEIYISKIDNIIKKKINSEIEFYFRYVDDMVIFAKDEERAKSIFEDIKRNLAILDLELNEEKQIIDKVKNIKYDIISDDLNKYFIDGIDENTPEYVKQKAKIILQDMFEKIKCNEKGEYDYKNFPFFLTHLIDDNYLEINKKNIIECIINNNIGRGSMYKHFYKNIIFRDNIEKLNFYKNIKDLSRSNFINTLLNNGDKVNKEELKQIIEYYIRLEDIKNYEKIELYLIVIENGIEIKSDIINDTIMLLRCVEIAKKLEIKDNILNNILIEIQKNDNNIERLKKIEQILKKSKIIESLEKLIDTIVATINKMNENKEKIKQENFQILYNIIAFSTLYINKIVQVNEIWKYFLNVYDSNNIRENEWYKFSEIMEDHKYQDNTIISFLTSELSGNHINDNKEITNIEMQYITSLIIYLAKVDIKTNKILRNKELKKIIQEISEEKNMRILEWCMNGKTQYFPNKEFALLNSQYNNRIVMMNNESRELLVRGKKEIFELHEQIEKENCYLGNEERYFKIYSIDDYSKIKNISDIIKDKDIFTVISMIGKVLKKIKQRDELVNIFEKGTLDEDGNLNLIYSKKDNKFICFDNSIINSNIEDVSRTIINKVLKMSSLKEIKTHLGRELKFEDIIMEFIPSNLIKEEDKLTYLINISDEIIQLSDGQRNNDYYIESAKINILTKLKNVNIANCNEYSNLYKAICLYNNINSKADNKLLYGKEEINEDNLYELIETIKNSLKKNKISEEIISDIIARMDEDLKKVEKIVDCESSKIKEMHYEIFEDNGEKEIQINGKKCRMTDLSILYFGKNDGKINLDEKQIMYLEGKKYRYYHNYIIIVLPDFLEKILESIRKKEGKYDYTKDIAWQQVKLMSEYDKAIDNIKLQNDISEYKAEKNLKKFLDQYDEKYYNALVYMISKYRIIDEADKKFFLDLLKKYLNNPKYEVCSLKDYINDRNGLDCLLRSYGKKFDRNENYDCKITRDLEILQKNSKSKLVIVSDIGISGSQSIKTIEEKINLQDYEEVIFLNCLYTDIYKKNIQKKFEKTLLKFDGTEIEAKEFMYNKLKYAYKEVLNDFFENDIDERILNLPTYFNDKITYRDYIKNLEEEKPHNILVGRYLSMPKAHHIIFDDLIFNYRKDRKANLNYKSKNRIKKNRNKKEKNNKKNIWNKKGSNKKLKR